MSRSNKQKKKKAVPGKPRNTGDSVLGMIPAVPAYAMCMLIFAVLFCDIASDGMAEAQYAVFPEIFRWLNYAVVLTGLIYYGRAAYKKEIRISRTDVLFIAFAVLIVISTLANGLTREAVNGVPYRYIGIFRMFAFMLVYMGLSGRPASQALKENALLLYLAAADAAGLAALVDLYAAAIPAFHEKKELSAVFFNGNHYGYFLLMAVLIGTGWFMYGEGKEQVFGAASAVFGLLMLALNHSMGCILAVMLTIAGMAVCILICDRDRLRRLAVLAGALAAGLIAALLLSSSIRSEFASLGADIAAILSGNAGWSTGHNRFLLWDITLAYIEERPLTGFGCEGIAFQLYEATGRSNPHSEILSYAAYYGIPAALCYAAAVISVFHDHFRDRKQAPASSRIACMAAAGYFISSMTGVAMFYTAPFFFIFLGMTRRK